MPAPVPTDAFLDIREPAMTLAGVSSCPGSSELSGCRQFIHCASQWLQSVWSRSVSDAGSRKPTVTRGSVTRMKPMPQPIASPVVRLRPGQSAYYSRTARLVLVICLTVTCVVLSKAANLVRVPKTNAIELLCHMKNDARLKAIPVVMLTSYN